MKSNMAITSYMSKLGLGAENQITQVACHIGPWVGDGVKKYLNYNWLYFRLVVMSLEMVGAARSPLDSGGHRF
jgi:hypothetical protein